MILLGEEENAAEMNTTVESYREAARRLGHASLNEALLCIDIHNADEESFTTKMPLDTANSIVKYFKRQLQKETK